MATFEEIMAAAVNADKAGDENAARLLVQEAQKMRGAPVARDQMVPRTDLPGYDTPATPTPDRFGDTIKDATEGPIAATKAYAAGASGSAPSITAQALPDNMRPAAREAVGRVGDAAMTGLSALGVGYAGTAGLIGETFGGTPTNERKLAADLMMAGEVAVPELAGVGGTIIAGGRAVTAAGEIPAATNNAQRRARAADDLGITPSLGMTGRTGAVVASQAEKMPIAGNTIAADAARFVGEAEGVFQRNVSRVGPSTNAASAGSQLQAGLNQFVDRFKAKASELYSAVDKEMPPGTTIAAPGTVAQIRAAVAPYANNPEIRAQLGLDKWERLASDMENGLSWEAARDLRSSIGESIGKINGPLANMDQGRLKQAYASLTNDLDAAVQQAGPQATAAWNRANTYYRSGSERISTQLDRTISADSPERAFEAFSAMTRDRTGGANSTRMLRIKNSLGAEQWQEVSGTIVDRLGRATDGAQNAAGDVFSPATFLTNWNKMSDEAKRILLPENVRVEMGKLAEVAEGSKAANAERNFSNTGNINAGIAALIGFQYAPMTTTGVIAGGTIAAKSMTNPVFLRALNRAARGDSRQIRAMANGNGPFKTDASTVLRISAAEAATPEGAANLSAAPQSARTAN